MSFGHHVSVSGFLSIEDRIASLRAAYDLADKHVVPTVAGDRIACHLNGCGWIRKLRDEERHAAFIIFKEHVQSHVDEMAHVSLNAGDKSLPQIIRPINCAGGHNSMLGMMSSYPNSTFGYRCSSRRCSQNLYERHSLVEHLANEHLDLGVAAYCPLCMTVITAHMQSEDTYALLNPRTLGAHGDPEEMIPIKLATGSGPVRTIMVTRDSQLYLNAWLVNCQYQPRIEDHPLLRVLQDILLEHYEAAKCDALHSVRRSVSLEDELARLGDWRLHDNSRI
ncbi:hypothetical protein BD626DRAFT_573469 [Schizophyllum amplum]|uniref:C2H2-type domain-containing protein n=1 Tax=Schizophyllum amplum TaxID=97359 RepID=A0A550C136_9AGAR|nr:hypothetical protein BD626DRAFT_573469 [Auriculariopsis ampla]